MWKKRRKPHGAVSWPQPPPSPLRAILILFCQSVACSWMFSLMLYVVLLIRQDPNGSILEELDGPGQMTADGTGDATPQTGGPLVAPKLGSIFVLERLFLFLTSVGNKPIWVCLSWFQEGASWESPISCLQFRGISIPATGSIHLGAWSKDRFCSGVEGLGKGCAIAMSFESSVMFVAICLFAVFIEEKLDKHADSNAKAKEFEP